MIHTALLMMTNVAVDECCYCFNSFTGTMNNEEIKQWQVIVSPTAAGVSLLKTIH